MGHPSPKYSAELKQQAVRLCRERGGTCAETARELGVGPGSLSDWVRRADAAQAPAGDNPFQMAEGLRRLRRENERLKRERDAFKSERLLRRQAAVGSRAEGARFAFILLNEGAWGISEMRAAPHVARRGCHAWRKRPPGAHDLKRRRLRGMGIRSVDGLPVVAELDAVKPYSSFINEWHKFIEKTGFGGTRPYALRHTFATLNLAYGENIKTISVVLGHVTPSYTLDLYVGYIPSTSAELSNRYMGRVEAVAA